MSSDSTDDQKPSPNSENSGSKPSEDSNTAEKSSKQSIRKNDSADKSNQETSASTPHGISGRSRNVRDSASRSMRRSVSHDAIESFLEAKLSNVLKRTMPPDVRKAVLARGIDPDSVLIATDTDLDIAGEYSESWIIVTNTHIYIFLIDVDEEQAVLSKEIAIADIETARTDSRVGSGFLEAKIDDIYEEIVRFSNKHADKFAKVAAQIRSLAIGRQVTVKPEAEARAEAEQEVAAKGTDAPHIRVRRGTVFFRFLRYTQSYWPYTLMAMSLVVCTILLMLVPPQLTKVLIDQVFEGRDNAPSWFEQLTIYFNLETRLQWLYLLVGLLAATTFVGSIIGICRESLSVWINNKLGYDLRREVFQKYQELAVRYHETQHVGTLMTRCTQDVETLQAFINQLTSGFGFQILLVIGVAFAMFSTNWWLAIIACVPAPVVMLSTVLFYRWVVPLWRKYWSTRSDLNSSLHAALSGIRVVKAFAQEKREEARFGKVSGSFFNVGMRVGYANSMFYPSMGFVFQLGSYFIWFYGGTQILDAGDMAPSVGDLIAFLGYLGMFYAPLNSLTQMSTWFTQFTTQAHRVFEILDQDPEIQENKEAIEIELQGAVEFRSVTFGYDPHIPVLREISFRVSPGEMVGIVGHSGSGKSTTVGLVMRFYDTTEGEITLDNIPIRQIQQRCLRRQIGLVAQDPYLFRGTIAENIAYGNPEVAPEQLMNGALQANAHLFIVRNHDGYDTRLGERGAGLSGGERQRVAIARALVHNPRILILDEATSSVDTISEREIQKALEALSHGRTTIAIAHRISTLKNCDRILVFEDGEIRQQGSHAELMAEEGIYRKLVETQMELAGSASVDALSVTAKEKLHQEWEANRDATPRHARNTLVPTIQYLDPKELHMYPLATGDLRITYKGESYDHVRAYRCFPISRPQEYIALWTGDTALEHREIGMIRRLKELSPSARLAAEYELAKRYFIHYIEEIYSIQENKNNIGFLIWEVKTDKGDMSFITKRYERQTVVEGGRNGRIIFDINDNRYEIVDLDDLDSASQLRFLTHIFW